MMSLHRAVVAVVDVLDELLAEPGQLNVVSVSTAPPSSRANCRPSTVITGTSALRKAWCQVTLRRRDAAGLGGLDVVALHGLEDVDPDQPDEDSADQQAERQGRQHEVLEHVHDRRASRR